jgi:hypothetical protein
MRNARKRKRKRKGGGVEAEEGDRCRRNPCSIATAKQIQGNNSTPKTGHKAKSNKRAPEQAPALGAEHYPANIWALARW